MRRPYLRAARLLTRVPLARAPRHHHEHSAGRDVAFLALLVGIAPLWPGPALGSEVRQCDFKATVLEVLHGPVAVELEGERLFSMTLRIRVSEASRKEGSHTDCTEYSGIEIQVPVLSKSRHTADKVKKNSVVRVEYSHVSGLSPQGVEVHENWWLTELVKR